MAQRQIEGIFAPVATLFDGDGELDLAKYQKNKITKMTPMANKVRGVS